MLQNEALNKLHACNSFDLTNIQISWVVLKGQILKRVHLSIFN